MTSRHALKNSRRRFPIWVIVCSIVATVILIVSIAIVLTPPSNQQTISPDTQPVVDGADSPPPDEERAFYSFGHSKRTLTIDTRSSSDTISQRLPFQLTTTPTAFRVVVRNIDYLHDTWPSGSVTVANVYIGASDSLVSGEYTDEPVRVMPSGILTDGHELASDWISTDDVPLVANDPYLLSMSWSADPGTELGISQGVAWLAFGNEPSAAGETNSFGEVQGTGGFFDITIEYSLPPDNVQPITTVIGHSLNSATEIPAGSDVSDGGEPQSWPQLWARQNGGITSTMSAGGSWTAHYSQNSRKWNLANDVTPDYLALWSSSSDLVAGTAPDIVAQHWNSVIETARGFWPDVKIVAFTEPPRAAEGQGEANRIQWNEFLRTYPEQIDALVDADEILKSTENPTVLVPEYTTDSIHLTLTAQQLIADAYEQTISAIS